MTGMQSVSRLDTNHGRVTDAEVRRLSLLVIIPALNEEATVGEVIRRLPRNLAGVDQISVLVVDDGSSDRTAEIARAEGARVISHAHNMGVGKALQSGLAEAVRLGVDLVVNIDADGQFAPEDISVLLVPLVAGEADFVTASRFKDPSRTPDMPRLKLWGNKGMSWLVSYLAGSRYHDVSCGFRAYSRETILRLSLMGRFTYTQETFLVLSHYGLRLAEVPLAVKGVREYGESRVASNLFRYATRTSRIILNCLRDHRPSLFFSLIGHALFVPGLALAAFFFGHRLMTGQFSPHLWAGFLSGYLIGTALLLYVFGQLASMIARLRTIQEEVLYHTRRAVRDGDK